MRNREIIGGQRKKKKKVCIKITWKHIIFDFYDEKYSKT